MVTINIAKVSSKGQIVIPKRLRKNFKQGDEVVFIEKDNNIILKKFEDLNENFRDEFILHERIEEAYGRYEKGKFVTKSKDDFLEELKEW